jgi:preprotein translocase subunit SecY
MRQGYRCVAYRFGTYIPISGIDTVASAETFKAQSSGILDMFAGGPSGARCLARGSRAAD